MAQQATILNSASIQYDAPDGGTDGGGDGGGNGGGGNGGGGNGGGGNGGGDGGGNGGDGGGTGRVNQLSNSVFYQFQTTATAGVNNAGLGIVKSANKSSAEPGDIVIYTLLVSTVTGDAPTLSVLDDLPDGVEYVDDSANAALVSPGNPEGVPVAFNLTGSENAITFTDFAPGLSQGQQLLIRYATTVSPDGVRGDGINTATASDIQAGLGSVSDTFRLTIRPGILSDCGTILGRVFSDTNFDGLQQPGEPGIPNAVIFMDSGNRIITDADGLFSMGNVISGNRVGALDTSSLNGYTLAPNLYRIEENGQSRLVHLEAGGLARMNFAVTPTFGEGE